MTLNQTFTVGGMTVTISAESALVLTAEVALGILIALEPWLILPVWLVIMLPILRADLPLAQLLFDEIGKFFINRTGVGVAHKDILTEIHAWFIEQNRIAAETPWYPTDSTPSQNSFPWTSTKPKYIGEPDEET